MAPWSDFIRRTPRPVSADESVAAIGAISAGHARARSVSRRMRQRRRGALPRPDVRPLRRPALSQPAGVQRRDDRGCAAERGKHPGPRQPRWGEVGHGTDGHAAATRRRRPAARDVREPRDAAPADGQPQHPHRSHLVGSCEPGELGGAEAPRGARHPLRGSADDRRRADQPQPLRSHGPRDAPAAGRGVSSAHRHGARQLGLPQAPRSSGRAGHRRTTNGEA